MATPEYLTRLPLLQDELQTESTVAELETAKSCLQYLKVSDDNASSANTNSSGLPKLDRDNHADFLHDALGKYPRRFVVIDASRPWMMYWSLAGLSMLGEDISIYRDSGGFGGGHGQLSHCAVSYAATLSLVMVGGTEAYDLIDRKAMWHWLGQMKQPDGGFRLCAGGEEDIRGAYCAMVIISLLNLPLELPMDSPARANGSETFLTQLPEWISSCQTHEGGIAAAPGNEAHGAYAFCALGCLSVIGEPRCTINKYLDTSALINWMTSRQTTPEGGFSGRTNKLVDGCYSHWVGGCWALIEAAVSFPNSTISDARPSLWNREALTRYIHCCCQGEEGGLRDKPGKSPDAYHTCYVLAGLCAAQNYYSFEPTANNGFQAPLETAFSWVHRSCVAKTRETGLGNGDDQTLEPVHPVFVVPFNAAETARRYFETKRSF